MFNVLFYPKYVPTAIHQRNHGMHLTRVTIINAHRPSPQTAACRSPTVLQLQQEVARPKARFKPTSPVDFLRYNFSIKHFICKLKQGKLC